AWAGLDGLGGGVEAHGVGREEDVAAWLTGPGVAAGGAVGGGGLPAVAVLGEGEAERHVRQRVAVSVDVEPVDRVGVEPVAFGEGVGVHDQHGPVRVIGCREDEQVGQVQAGIVAGVLELGGAEVVGHGGSLGGVPGWWCWRVLAAHEDALGPDQARRSSRPAHRRSWWSVGDALPGVCDIDHHALLTHQGKYQARIAGAPLAARAPGRPVDPAPWGAPAATADSHAVPQMFFCAPPAGAVGLTADQAERAGHRIRVIDLDPGATVIGASLYADGYTGRARTVVE